MNVCLLNDSFPPVIDGVVNVVMNYARILQESGRAKVVVATPSYPEADYSVYPYPVVPYQSFDTTRIVDGYRAGNPFDLSELEELVAFQPDIIHTHCPVSSAILGRLLKHRTGAPLLLTYHTKYDIDIARAFKTRAVQEGAIRALVSNIEACDEVWVVSQGAGENLRSLGYTGDYIVMNNGVDFAKGRVPEAEVRVATAGYDLPEGVPVFLYVGRMMTYKGLPLILEALTRLEQRHVDYRMVFVGGGPDLDAMKARAETLGLRHCIFTGPISDRQVLRAWNTRADLFLFPSTFDTNGIVVREAAACGLASVLVRGSCAAEGITHGQNGYLIQETPDSLAELLLTAGQDRAELDRVGLRAMDEIYISWEDSVRAAYDRYQVILENHRRGLYDTGRRQPIQELRDGVRQFTERSRERLESVYEGSRMEGLVDAMRDDFETMLGNAVYNMDERLEEIHQWRQRLVQRRDHLKHDPPRESDGDK